MDEKDLQNKENQGMREEKREKERQHKKRVNDCVSKRENSLIFSFEYCVNVWTSFSIGKKENNDYEVKRKLHLHSSFKELAE